MDATTPALAVALLAAWAYALGAQSTQRYTLRGSDLAVWNLVGAIRLESGSGEEAEVEVTRRGPDAGQLRVETGRLRGRETLRIIYPEDRIIFDSGRSSRWGAQRLTVSVDEDGTFRERHEDSRTRRVEIRSSGSGLEASADVRVRVPRGKSVAIYLADGEATVTNVEGEIHADVNAATVTTSGTRGLLSLDTGSGETNVSDVEGELALDSGSGEVKITRVRGTKINIDAGSGAVRAADLDAEQLSVDGGSGRLELRGVRAKGVELDVGSGSVELQLRSDVDRLTVDGGSGSVNISVPEALGAMLTVETGSGGIDFDVPITVTRQSRHYLAGQLGDGRGRIMIETGSGSIHFRRS